MTPSVRAAATREAIMEAARHEFGANGYDRATTRAIARRAGVAEGTLYRHFSGKQELLTACLADVVLAPIHTLFCDDGRTDRQIICDFITDRIRLWSNNLPALRVLLSQAMFNDSVRQSWYEHVMVPGLAAVTQYIQRRIDQGVFRPVQPQIAARALLGMVLSLGFMSAAVGGERLPHTEDTLVETFADLFLSGMLATH